jgi:hypothetical protein
MEGLTEQRLLDEKQIPLEVGAASLEGATGQSGSLGDMATAYADPPDLIPQPFLPRLLSYPSMEPSSSMTLLSPTFKTS